MGIRLSRNRSLEEADRRYIWHPFTQMKEWVESEPVIIEEGRGVFLKDIYGRWYIDGVASIWVNVHGHRRREIDEAIKAQLDRIAHSTLLGLGNVPSVELAERLVSIAPRGLTRVFYSDNGSTSVEVALKMAFQYWQHKGEKNRTAFLCLNNAYHGDTIGAVSVGGIELFHEIFRPLLFRSYRAPSPYCYRCELGLEREGCGLACLEEMERILRRHHEEIAAIIIEPMVQGAGGMILFPEGYLRGVSGLCKKYGLLLIADEVAVGFGRTGRIFACEHEDVVPDFLCLSKGITGGYLPLAVTLTTEEVYSAFLGEFSELKTFFHGHSYTGNPLACAAAMASLELFFRDNILDAVRQKEGILKDWFEEIRALPHVGDARGIGLIGGVELVEDRQKKTPYPYELKMGYRVCEHARQKGLLIRPLGNVVVIMPPLCISQRELQRMLDIIAESIEEVTSSEG
ncbi:MAG TPA: adenosylmethionine--8-amino-7-oxononanoate transaminase [Nitrospirae bacterium]|nr:adenosylmethionine--8-amino-7-oxononanoate transaminase [Nitrospirota bacterium]